MATTILATKLYVPQPPSTLISRPRLIQKLDQCFDKKLTLVSAPAGFGKTTLLSDCVTNCGRLVSWLSLDSGDNDFARFFSYVIAALQTIKGGFGEGLMNVLGSPQQPPIETFLTDLINEISSTMGHFVLVLDDYHHIESETIDKTITFILNHCPTQMHLVISTRTDPSLPLSGLRARGYLAELREKDLRFTFEETKTFLETAMGLKLSKEILVALETRTEGWIAGLQLAGLSMQGLKGPAAIDIFVENFSSSHRYILDYLTDEVLQQRPVGTREFLYHTSILNRLSASLCEAVTGIGNCQEVLETLDTSNLFLIPLDNERCWYRYHHLFRDLLQKRLSLLQPEMVTELHLRAAMWYKQYEDIPEALDHFLAAGDYSGAADLVEENAQLLLERSELATLISWVDTLPEDQVRNRPWLCVYHAWALRLSGTPFGVVESRIEDTKTAIKVYKESRVDESFINDLPNLENQIEKLNGHVFALQAFQHLYKEDIPSVLELTKHAQGHDLEENFVRASIAFARGWALRFSGDLKSAYKVFADTKKFSLASANVYMAVAASCRAAYGRVLGGELKRAYEELQEAIGLATRKDGKQIPVIGYAYVYLGGILYEWNDLESAKRYLLEGIDNCGRVGYIMDQVVGLVTLAMVQKADGDWDGVQKTMQEAENLRQRMKTYTYLRRWVENIRIRHWQAQDAWDEINNWIQTCGLTTDDDLDFNRDLEHLILARALVYSGLNQPSIVNIRDAEKLLQRLLEKTEAAEWVGKVIEILVLQALVFQSMGDRGAAINKLDRALRIAEPEGYIRTFIDEGKPMHGLLSEYIRGIDNPTVVQEPSTARYAARLLVEFKKEKVTRTGQQMREDFKFKDRPIIESLSNRQFEVLQLMATGLTNQEIAGELVIAVTTAKKHVSNIIRKFGVSNRTQAVARARDLNLL